MFGGSSGPLGCALGFCALGCLLFSRSAGIASASSSGIAPGSTTPLEAVSDKECVDVLARLKIVYGTSTYDSAMQARMDGIGANTRVSASAQSKPRRISRLAILAEDGCHLVVTPKSYLPMLSEVQFRNPLHFFVRIPLQVL